MLAIAVVALLAWMIGWGLEQQRSPIAGGPDHYPTAEVDPTEDPFAPTRTPVAYPIGGGTLTPPLTRTPNPTALAYSAAEYAQVLVESMSTHTPYITFELVDAADIYPEDAPFGSVSAAEIEEGSIPDVAIIVKESDGTWMQYRMFLLDRATGRTVSMWTSDNPTGFQNGLP